jgi:microcystin-dependent protein
MQKFKIITISAIILILSLLSFLPVQADSPTIGEIKIWPSASNVPPGWVVLNGQGLSKTTYSALYSIVGVTYGDGGANFLVPNLQGRTIVAQAGAIPMFDTVGETGGETSHTLTIAEMPSHRHAIYRSSTRFIPSGTVNGWPGSTNGGETNIGENTQYTGSGTAFNVTQPYMVMTYIIYTGVGLPTPTPTPITPTPTRQRMEPITNTTTIGLILTNTLGISISTIPVTTNTTVTTGTLYLPFTLYQAVNYDPYRILSSLTIFLAIGVMIKKPTAFIIAWLGLTLFGIFSLPGVFWYWTAIMLISLFMLFWLFSTMTRK